MYLVIFDFSIFVMIIVMNFKFFKIIFCKICFIFCVIYIIYLYMFIFSIKMCEGLFFCNIFLKRKKIKILLLLNNELFVNIKLFLMILKKVII